MSLASTWVQMYQARGLTIEEARTSALANLNKALATNCTRGDLWRWEQGAGMHTQRRNFILRETLPYICKLKRWRMDEVQMQELLEMLL